MKEPHETVHHKVNKKILWIYVLHHIIVTTYQNKMSCV